MIYFGFVELIEKALKWAKEFPRPVNPVYYWGSGLIAGYVFYWFVDTWQDYGFSSAKPLLIFSVSWTICVFISFFAILLYDRIRKRKAQSEG